MDFIKQCKAMDVNKLEIRDDEMFFCSIKRDGVYIQIQKEGDDVAFFTSSGKRFDCIFNADFAMFDFDFKIEAEYICDGGKLGTRAKADNEIKKAVKNPSFKLTGGFMIFDSLEDSITYEDRDFLFIGLSDTHNSIFKHTITYKEAKNELKKVCKEGWEGLILKRASHIQVAGKKSKNAVKLKPKYTADLVVVDVDGLWVSLQGDDGLCARVQVNAAVADDLSEGDIIEIEYEQIIKTYNQAIFKRVRYDKMGE